MTALRSSPSGREFLLDTDAVENLSDVPGETLTEALDNVGSQLQREVYYADGFYEVYDASNVLLSRTLTGTVDATGATFTWLRPDVGKDFRVWVVPGASSGSTGCVSGNGIGGVGAGGGFVGDRTYVRSDMPTTATVRVGRGAAAAAPVVAAAGANTDGNPGAAGNPSRFGNLLSAYHGGPGLLVGQNSTVNSGGSGGGSTGAGPTGSSSANVIGGRPAITGNAPGAGGQGAGTHTTVDGNSGSNGNEAEDGGGSGGGSRTGGVGLSGGAGGNSLRGIPGAGGGGGALNVSGNQRNGGGASGFRGARSDGSTSGNGTPGSAPITGIGNGVDGTDGADGSVLTCTPGMPGSGGMGGITSGAPATSGRGGDGGFPGGPGAGSGACFASTSTSSTAARSGAGRDGVVVVVANA